MSKILYLLFFLSLNFPIYAATITASTGTWSTLSWSPSGPPSSTDDIVIPTGVTVTMDADFTTTGSLTLQGTGTIEMSGFNLTAGSLTASGAAIINNGSAVATLSIGSANSSTTYTGNLTGAISLTKSGTGSLTLSGSNAFTGNITITNSGTNALNFNTGSNTFAGTVTSTTSSSGTTYFSNSGSCAFSENITINCTSTGATNFGNSGGTTTLAASKTISCNTYSGTGTLYFRNFTQTGSGTDQTLNLSTTGKVTFYTGNTFNSNLSVTAASITLSGTTFGGNVTLEQNGSATATGAGGNTYNGTVTVTNSGNGHIIMNQTADVFNGDVTITNSGTGTVKFAQTSGTTLFNGNIVFNRTNTSSYQANGLYFGASGGGGSSSLADGKTITCNTAAWIEFSNFTQIGTTAQVLNASSTGSPFGAIKFYAGTVFNGPLTVSTASIGLSGGTFNNTTVLQKSGGGDNGASGGITINGPTTISNTSGSGKLDLTVSPTLNNTLTIEGSRSINFLAALANNGYLITVNSSSTISFTGVISGSGGITQAGSGNLSLSGANTYTGETRVTAGYLYVQHANALGAVSSGTVVESGGTLDIYGLTYTLEEPITISGTGTSSSGAIRNSSGTATTFPGLITLAANSSIVGTGSLTLSNTGTITGSGYTLTLSGSGGGTINSIIGTNTGGITKSGNGTWTLSGANTYTGATTISTGILKLGNTAALGTNASGTTIASGGALDLNGYTLSSAEALTISGTGVSSGGALINTGAAASYTGSITLGAATTMNTANNITLSGTISPSTYTLTKAGTASLLFDNNTVTLNGLTISAGTVNCGAATINFNGAITNSGTFTCGTSTVNLVGTTAQTIPAITFHNLTINNTTSPSTSAATLSGNIVIGGTLTMTTGILNTSSYTIDLGANGSIAESNPNALAPTSYVTGYVTATRNIGSSSGTVTFGGLGLEITESNESNNSTVVTRRTGTASTGAGKSSILRYYDITPTVDVNLNGTLVFHYTTAEFGSQTEANLIMYKSDSPYSSWTQYTASSVDASNNTVTLTGITDFSRWTVSDKINNPLPVDYLSFKVKKVAESNTLFWVTANEINNDYFEVERSNNGVDFYKIGNVKGAGTKNTATEYSYTDPDLNPANIIYYRIKQVDYDRKSSYSPITQIAGFENHNHLEIFPNPLEEGEILYANISDDDLEIVKVSLFDLSGKLLHSFVLHQLNPTAKLTVENENLLLKKGIYLIEIKTIYNDYIQRLEVK